MSDEMRITLAIVCAALGAVIGMGLGYALEGFGEAFSPPVAARFSDTGAAFGLRLVLTGGLALLMLRKTLRETT